MKIPKEIIIMTKEIITIDFIAIELKEILYLIDEILGRNTKEDILNELFSKYCLGK